MEESENDKRISLLSYGNNYCCKKFIVQAPEFYILYQWSKGLHSNGINISLCLQMLAYAKSDKHDGLQTLQNLSETKHTRLLGPTVTK